MKNSASKSAPHGALTFLAAAILLVSASGCGSSPSSGDGTPEPGTTGTCTESAIFPLRGFGDNNTDVIRQIRTDETTNDVLFTDLKDTFLLRSGSSTPEKVNSNGETFWLRDDVILYPGGVQQGSEVPVLLSKPSTGGDAKVVVTTPASTNPLELLTVEDVWLSGDDVVWTAEKVDRSSSKSKTTTYLRRTSWRAPAEPQLLYTSEIYLADVIIGGGKIYITETATFAATDTVQKIIDLKSGNVEAQNTTERFGGDVTTADDDSVVVKRFHYEQPVSIGLFLLAHDGTGEVKLSDHPLALNITSRRGTWAFVNSAGIDEPAWLWTYSAAAGLKKVGCADGTDTTVHALALDANAAYLSIFRGPNAATILRYPL